MLRTINPVLSPDILYVLAAMGHGDDIVIGDANYPAVSCGPRCLHAEASDASQMLRAVLSLMPLDTFVPDPALCMQVVGDPDTVPDTIKDFQAVIDDAADAPAPISSIERFAFYDRAATAFAIIQTGERRLYGNIILKKGVIA